MHILKFIWNFILTPAAVILTAMLQFDTGHKMLASFYLDHPRVITWTFIICTAINYFVNFALPYFRNKRIVERGLENFYEDVQEMIDVIKDDYDVDININVMEPKTVFLTRLEPKKTRFFVKILRCVRQRPRHVNTKLRFTIHQGVCGDAFRTEEYSSSNIEAKKINGDDIGKVFNLSEQQVVLTEKVNMIASAPIFKIDKMSWGDKVTIIGVISAESRDEDSGYLADDPFLNKNLKKLAKIYALTKP